MEEILLDWDGECVIARFDRVTGAWIFVAVHDRTLGMAMGGCRLKTYPSPADALRDAVRLAQGMTMKWAAIDFPFGGGKAVLAPPPGLAPDGRRLLLERFGELIESLGGMYGTGVDLGTSPPDMDVVGEHTRYVFGRSPENGGAGDPGPWTALGVFHGLLACAEHVWGEPSVRGRSVLVQGVGGVGAPLARLLGDAGARLLLSDAVPPRVASLAGELKGEVVAPEAAYDVACDIFAPCAIGGVINARSIPRLGCRVVGGSANNQLETPEDAGRLHERSILYAPDFVINAGGAISHGALEVLGWTPERVAARVQQIGPTLLEMLIEADRRGESPLLEAQRRALRTLAAAREARTGAGVASA